MLMLCYASRDCNACTWLRTVRTWCAYASMHVCMYGGTYKCTHARTPARPHARKNEWMHGWMDGWMDGCMHACMHAWMDGWMDGCVYIYICIGIYNMPCVRCIMTQQHATRAYVYACVRYLYMQYVQQVMWNMQYVLKTMPCNK